MDFITSVAANLFSLALVSLVTYFKCLLDQKTDTFKSSNQFVFTYRFKKNKSIPINKVRLMMLIKSSNANFYILWCK